MPAETPAQPPRQQLTDELERLLVDADSELSAIAAHRPPDLRVCENLSRHCRRLRRSAVGASPAADAAPTPGTAHPESKPHYTDAGWLKRAADSMADAIERLVVLRRIDSRSGAADAALNYRSPAWGRLDYIESLEAEIERLKASDGREDGR